MKFAYADPPYLGCGRMYDAHHPEARQWDKWESHARLIFDLEKDYPDGWALSASSPSLTTLLEFCPDEVRIGAWVKPFASFKPNVNPAYAWEPVIFMGGRKRDRSEPTVRDWVAANITLERGLTGAKPREFCFWVFQLLGAQKDDELVDLFPGTGAITAAWKEYTAQPVDCGPLFPMEAA